MDIGKQSKKIAIRKFKQKTFGTDFNLETYWETLRDAVIKIQKRQKTTISREELYNIVENLCHRDYAGEIYNRLQLLINDFARSCYETLINTTKDAIFLEALDKLWNEFCNQMYMIRSMFLFMDRTYRVQNTPVMSIWDFSLEAFRMSVFDNFQLKNCTVKSLLNLIAEERSGNEVNRHLLKSMLRMFISLQIYDNVFEPEFLKTTQKMYENESRERLQELEIADYLKHVAKRINEEEHRIDMYLDVSTAKKLINVTDMCFLANYVDAIVSKGTDTLFAGKRLEDLKLLYRLFSRVKHGLPTLKSAFSDYIKKVGRTIVADVSRDKTLVQDLMDFKADLDIIILACFNNNEKYIQAEKDAFDYFINTRPNRPAELIAKFMDLKLRTGNKECSEEELDAVMDKVIVLFRFIQGKDVFEAFYKKDLAKRLLLGRSASVDAEKAMLSKLKNECGAGFTQKLEGMFKDMEVSREFCSSFKQPMAKICERLGIPFETNGETSNAEVNVSILTMGNWPTYSIMEVSIPDELSRVQEICEKNYAIKHNGRKLHWQHSLTSAILKATFKKNVMKELDVSLFQTMVLLMFNTKTEYSFQEILTHTKIEELELKRTLQSLACGKFRVLQKFPKGKEVHNDDKFIFNEDFNVHLYRIRISQVQMRETEEEHQQTEEQIFQDRQYQIDAAIVRIMKMRKNLAHNLLLTELFNQLRFAAKPVDLKKRIESLIEREYMSRDKDDAQLYRYVA